MRPAAYEYAQWVMSCPRMLTYHYTVPLGLRYRRTP